MKKEKFDIGSISDGGGFGMNLKRIGIIVGAHIVAIGVFYLAGTVGSEDDGSASLAGANGLKIWDNQSPNANEPTVDPSSMSSFDNRAGDLSGYNAGDAPRPTLLASSNLSSPSSTSNSVQSSNDYGSAPVITSRQRSEPQRPAGYSSPSGLGGDFGYNTVPNSTFEEPMLPPTIVNYTVKKGDSIWGIGRDFKVTTKEITDANPGLKVNTIRVGQTLKIPQAAKRGGTRQTPVAQEPVVTEVDGSAYVVKSGDTLSKIAARQGTTLNALKIANNLSNDMIRVGQKLRIPNVSRVSSIASNQRSGTPVTVKSGDSVGGIANRYGVSTKELMVYNDIKDARRLQVGQILYVPQKNGGRQIEVEQPKSQPVQVDRRPPVNTAPVTAPPPQQTLPVADSQPTISFEDDADLLDEAKVDAPVIPIE